MSEAKLQKLELPDPVFLQVQNGKLTSIARPADGSFTLGYLEFYAGAKKCTVLVTTVSKAWIEFMTPADTEALSA